MTTTKDTHPPAWKELHERAKAKHFSLEHTGDRAGLGGLVGLYSIADATPICVLVVEISGAWADRLLRATIELALEIGVEP